MSMLLVPAPSPEIQAPSCTQRLVDTPATRQQRVLLVEVVLVLLACSLIFMGVFGGFRRSCTSHSFARAGSLAYAVSFPAITYALGLIQNATFCNALFPVGAIFMVMLLGSAHSYTAHSLKDNEQWKSFNIKSGGICIIISGVMSSYLPTSKEMQVALYLSLLVFMKVDDRVRAMMSASNDVIQKKYISLADYMSTEHQRSNSNQVDLSSLQGYKYFVREAKEIKEHLWFSRALWRRRPRWLQGEAPEYQMSLCMTDDVITVEKVWNCGGRLLSASGGDPDGQLKDLCLSFSLFQLICLRFAGYLLPREAHDKLWSLIRHSLLSEENGYERVFRVIEVELAFLFDQFYTTFSVTLIPRRIVLEVLQLVTVLLFTLAIVSSYPKSQNGSMWSNADALVTFFAMVAILATEIVQFGIRIFSEWAKISYICFYVRNEWCQGNRYVEKLMEIMCGIKLRKPWGGRLRQYSFLEKCSYHPPKWKYNQLTEPYIDQERNGQEQIAPTKLSKEVMKAVAQSLMNNGTRNLENGRASLRRNNVFDQLSRACDLESNTHVIMVWHIATSLCEHEQRGTFPFPQASQGYREHFHIATVLSKYLAYLVAFAPRLLPGHTYRSEYIFSRVVNEARKLFQEKSILMGERIQKLKVLDDEQYGTTVVGRGARLGRQLLIEAADEEHIWTILADFWAEMMLYVAPSDDTEAHAKYLTTGGEFVTHVWVLLCHAGIMRGPQGSEPHDPERY